MIPFIIHFVYWASREYRLSLTYSGSAYKFYTLQWYISDMILEIIFWILNFDLFPGS
jgi:hypothetical protein